MIKISDAELEVLKVIWSMGEATSLEIIDELKDTKWSGNTVRTLVIRLKEKGAIGVARKNGKQYTYKALISQKKYRNQVLQKFIDKLYNNSFEDLVLEYCAAKHLTLEEIKNLFACIEEKYK